MNSCDTCANGTLKNAVTFRVSTSRDRARFGGRREDLYRTATYKTKPQKQCAAPDRISYPNLAICESFWTRALSVRASHLLELLVTEGKVVQNVVSTNERLI